ncbi:MAG: hypothetical protein IK954_06125 [Clostridia bacterium]|nr:hypothetical protein [Clostridia bacterium]
MKKLVTLAISLVLLFGLCAMPASADEAVPAATDWFACQDIAAPTHSVVTAKNGRIIVESVDKGSAMPGAGAVWYTQPIDFDNFEVSFSLDQYTKCRDQYFGIYFVNGGTSMQTGINDTPDPYFLHLLRPTDLATVIGTGEGLIYNYDQDRDMIRVGKSSFGAGQWLEGEMEASWTNVVYSVSKRADGNGYDVKINGKLVNPAEQNKWTFIDKIEAKTGCSDWYVGFGFKDGDYGACKFTIKTINGHAAVDPSASGYIQNSLLPNGGDYIAVGGKLGQYVTKPEAPTTTTTAPQGGNTTTTVGGNEGTTTTVGGDTTTTTAPQGGDTTTTTAPQDDQPGDAAPQDLGWLLWVGIAVVVIAAGICVYLFVIRPKTKK